MNRDELGREREHARAEALTELRAAQRRARAVDARLNASRILSKRSA